MDSIWAPVELFKLHLNHIFANKEPWQISTITASSVLLTVWLYDFLFQDESIIKRTKKAFYRAARRFPAVKEKVDQELNTINKDFLKEVAKRNNNLPYITDLPSEKKTKEEILELLKVYINLGEYKWDKGRVSGSIYYSNKELVDIVKETYGMASYTNPLHPDVFPGLCKMEAEIIRISAKLFHGDQETCGTMTTGGTESILMACKAYRDYGREVKGIRKPEMIIPRTAHSAFEKAGQYFNIKIKQISIDPLTTKVNIREMKRAITSNTIMLLGSAPNFPYGTMDDIAAISDLGVKYDIPVHVDSCLGGFLTVFMDAAGYPIPTCDFRLPGVTSISADTHKYGYAPKGTSIVLYSDKKYLHHQYTKSTDWVGGVYCSPSVNGSRAGGSIAACWATMLSFGKEGYINITRDIIHTTKYIEKCLRRMEGIYIFGQPATSVVAIGSHLFEIYRLQSALSEKGWNLNILQYPSGIHICVTHLHTKDGVADQFISDVETSLAEILKDPRKPTEGKMAMYGYSQSIGDRSIIGDITDCFLDSLFTIPDDELLNGVEAGAK